jgi:hypothetical protein
LFIGWHEHPSDPAAQSVGSTMPEAPGGIWHFPALQIPLAQSAPVMQVVFCRPGGMQSPPVHVPLWQSLAWVQCEPAGEPEVPPPAPPVEDDPPVDIEPPLDVEPPAPVEPPVEVEPLVDIEPPAPVEPPVEVEPPAPEVSRGPPL